MFIVNWWKRLSWKVKVSWSKNACLPILAATLLINWKITLNNVPNIWDVKTMLEIMASMWVKYEFNNDKLFLDTSNLSIEWLEMEKIKKIRASILLLAPLLHFFKKLSIPSPWWCSIGKRPIDSHLNWLKAIWYNYEVTEKTINVFGGEKSGDTIINAWFWVTWTENLIVANVLRSWVTTIKSAAIEPHVMNVVDLLRTAWADIKIRYDHTIVITWVKELKKEIEFDVISDYIESGTFMVMWALLSENYIDIENARINDLYAFIEKLKEAGVKVEDLWNDTLRVYRCDNLKAVTVQTNLYPGFPTDLQSPFTILLTQAEWISKVHEVLFESRLNFLVELEKMKWHVAILNPHEALIFGKTKLKAWATLTSWDLRAWVAMVIAAMLADWESQITNIDYIKRGYSNFVEKMSELGADIREVA